MPFGQFSMTQEEDKSLIKSLDFLNNKHFSVSQFLLSVCNRSYIPLNLQHYDDLRLFSSSTFSLLCVARGRGIANLIFTYLC